MKPYNSDLIPYARTMRKEMTSAERRLWFCCLCNAPYKFRRQRPIGPYIADFYSAALHLVIEVDGGGHYDEIQIQYDRERTTHMQSWGLRVLRFTNDEVFQQIDDVKIQIFSEFKTQDSLPPLRSRGGGSRSETEGSRPQHRSKSEQGS